MPTRRTISGRAATSPKPSEQLRVAGHPQILGQRPNNPGNLVLTGHNEARLDETAYQIRRAAPAMKIEIVAADLSSRSGVPALLDHVGDRPVEVLVNNG